MGCCQSRERTTSNQATQTPNLPHDSSRAAIIHPSGNGTSSPPLPAGANTRPNQPIRSPSPIPTSPAKVSPQPPPWTKRHLESERVAFFETRVSGNEEVWKALSLVCEMVRNGETSEAQGILDALNVTCPTGRIARERGRHKEKGGVFDERGQLYDIPAWVVTDPLDIVPDQEKDDEIDEDADAADEDADDSAVAASGQQKDEKGKGRAEDPGEMISIRARLSNSGTDVLVNVGTKQKIAVVVRQIQQQIGSKRVRLMYLGKTLDERLTVEETAWRQGHVVNALVFEGDEKMLAKRS